MDCVKNILHNLLAHVGFITFESRVFTGFACRRQSAAFWHCSLSYGLRGIIFI